MSGNLAAIVELARQETEMKHFEEGLALYRAAEGRIAEKVEFRLGIATCLMGLHRYQEAWAELERTRSVARNVREVHAKSALVLLYLDEREKLMNVAEDLFALDPGYPLGRILYGVALLVNGRGSEAGEHFSLLAAEKIGFQRHLLDLSRHLFGLGVRASARRLLEGVFWEEELRREVESLQGLLERSEAGPGEGGV
jgi:hypothetical protein